MKIKFEHRFFYKRLLTKVLSICLLIPFPDFGWSQTINTFSASRNEVSIPFEYVNGFIIVNLTLNNKLPLKFLLDTGAQHTLITKKEIADILDFEYKKEFKIVGADMKRALIANLVTEVSFRVGEFEFDNQAVLVLDEDYFLFEEMTGMNIHGILGGGFLRNFVLEIDYNRKKITFYSPAFYSPPTRKFLELPINVENNKPFVQSDIFFPNLEKLKGAKLLVDSGAGITMMLDVESNSKVQIPANAIPGNIGSGLGGDLLGFVGLIPKIKISEIEITNIPANFQVIENDTFDVNRIYRNGLIGNQILDRFKLIIDYRREKLYLQPNKTLNKPFDLDKSGISVIATGANLRKFLIQSVLKASPAGEVGLEPGDQILSINRIYHKFLSLNGIIKKLKRKEGKKIRMLIKRDGVKQKVKFELKNLFEMDTNMVH